MKMTKLLSLNLIALAVLSGCSTSTHRSFTAGAINLNVTSNMLADVEVDMTKKISGTATQKKVLIFTTEAPEYFADGVTYSVQGTSSGGGLFFGGLFGDASGAVKAAAAYNALHSAKADIIVAPQYVVKQNKGLFTEEISVMVTGYPGKLKAIKPAVGTNP